MNTQKKKQITLLESWASLERKNSGKQTIPKNNSSGKNVIDLCDSDDELLLQALENSAREEFLPKNNNPAILDLINSISKISSDQMNAVRQNEPNFNLNHSFSDGLSDDESDRLMSEFCETVEDSYVNQVTAANVNNFNDINKQSTNNNKQSRHDLNFSTMPLHMTANVNNQVSPSKDPNFEPQKTVSKCEGFNKENGKTWIYPTNRPIRDYQFNIVRKALFNNTLVCLPTGLGKTFVAAVVMYNYYRWYPNGKVIFMAPTKPLVAQQIQACHEVTGIPSDDTSEMTGAMQPEQRKKFWNDKRVFYLTPQVMMNDLQRGACPALQVKCLVVDEAHKALGNHAYCQVVKELSRSGSEFRVVALSATPGSDLKAVQHVLTNLMISHVELRTEESLDVQKFTHRRSVEKVVVPLEEEITKVSEQYLKVIERAMQRLKQFGVIYQKSTKNLSKFLILKSRDAFRNNPPPGLTVSIMIISVVVINDNDTTLIHTIAPALVNQ